MDDYSYNIWEFGELSERFKELVLKTSDTAMYREFESHTLRQKKEPVHEGLAFLFLYEGSTVWWGLFFYADRKRERRR